MTSVMKCLAGLSRLTLQSVVQPSTQNAPAVGRSVLTAVTCQECLHRPYSKYQPYPDIKTPSPYKDKLKSNFGYKFRLHAGGVLPRPKGDYEHKPLPMPMWKPHKKDKWTQQKAVFGQNDYIDILGDGNVLPFQTMKGPNWLQAYKGTEMQRLIRRLKFQGAYMREMYPTKHHNLQKRLFFLFKKRNRRKHATYWGSRRVSARSRVDRIPD